MVVLVVLACAVLFHSLFIHQTFLGNYPMSIRWMAHRFLLARRFNFYQNEFAGRITTKVMQTSLAIRETVLKLLDVILYADIYFTSVVVVVAALDLRLVASVILRSFIYFLRLRYFLPRLLNISARQADARWEMSGRMVGTFTNIATVKLFSHANSEAGYA